MSIVKVIHLNLYFQIKKNKDSDDSVKVQFGII